MPGLLCYTYIRRFKRSPKASGNRLIRCEALCECDTEIKR